MKAGIFYNSNYKDDNRENIQSIFSAFCGEGDECKTVVSPDDLEGLDVLFILGGDGTILTVAAECGVRGVKILGINYGHMGFLTEFGPDNLGDAIQLVKSKKFAIEKRSMLKIECRGKVYYALNDLVIQRSTYGAHFTNTVNLHAEIDGVTVDNFSADGIIVSTPTGSTAYSLSAGGPVLAPELEAFVLTPICAHSLHSKPVIFSDKSVLTVKPLNCKTPLALSVDGKIIGKARTSEIIKVTKAETSVEFITAGDKNFFNKLLIKLNFWGK